MKSLLKLFGFGRKSVAPQHEESTLPLPRAVEPYNPPIEKRLRTNTLWLTVSRPYVETIPFQIPNFPDGENYIKPWVNFYRWYFGRKSDCFVLRFKDGAMMIQRCDIVRFQVNCQ